MQYVKVLLKKIIIVFYLKNSYIFVPAIKLKTKTNIMKTFLSKQKYQVYAMGIIALYFLTRQLY